MIKYVSKDTLRQWAKTLRFLSQQQLREAIERLPVDQVVEKNRLIEMIRYSSQYNEPCPEWVYNVIKFS